MFLSSTSNYAMGLDISDLSLKIVQLDKIANKIKVQAIGRVDLPEGLIDGGDIKNKDEVVKILKKLINNPQYGRFNSNRVVACLPETKTFVKLIEVTKSANELSDVIENEIQKHVPLLIDEIYYDWQVVEDRESSQLVLIGAAPRKIVNQYTNLFDMAKISVEALEIEPLAICRSVLKEEFPDYKEKIVNNYAIIDIGATRTNIIIYSKNTILFTSSIPISGRKITNSISEALEIEQEKAEKAKIICGLDKNKCGGVIRDILTENLDELIDRLRDIFEFYEDHFSQRGPITKIMLCGGGANIKDIESILKETFKTNVEKADSFLHFNDKFLKPEGMFSFKAIRKSKKIQEVFTSNSNSTFATAIGLALRGVFIDDL